MSRYTVKEVHTTESLAKLIEVALNQNFIYLDRMVSQGDVEQVEGVLESLEYLVDELKEDIADRKIEIEDEDKRLKEQGLS